jgi:hypothetical protein
VLVLGVQGMDRRPVDDLRQSLTAAGATLQGTVWFTSRLRLVKDEDTTALAALLDVAPRGADTVRRSLVTMLAAELSGQANTGLLAKLRDASFVQIERPAGASADPAAASLATTRFVVVSDTKAQVANGSLALPFTTQLAEAARGRVLAAEPSPAAGRAPVQKTLFVGPLRADDQVSPLLATVDDLDDFRGRFAVVYALRDMGVGKVGHYGVGSGASRLVPESAG